MNKGGNMPCILNAANEVVVAAFLKDQIGFLEMSDVIAECMQKVAFMSQPSYDDYVVTDKETRIFASSKIKN
jgi:1-deoxy-D-xylulose-5-phosphate reductoisomerase